MSDLLAILKTRLEEFGLRVETTGRPPDGYGDVPLILSRGSSRREFVLELSKYGTLSHVRHNRSPEEKAPTPLIGASSVSSRSADAFRRAGIQYVDAGGNASIRFGDVLIDVRGRRSERDAADGRMDKGGNLFSTARAQVAFALLQWPRSWKKPQREVADIAGVSLGQANDAMKMFRDNGFGPGGHRTDDEFLDLWAASFPNGLGRKLLLATFHGSIQGFRTLDSEAVVSGEFAAEDLIRPTTLTIYVTDVDPMLPVMNRWRSREPSDSNVTVRRKFWKTPLDESPEPAHPSVGLPTAPSVLVFADLLSSNDPRVRNVAAEWRDRSAHRDPGR
ncbi:type IV toxin-antitoxin system AbiEi family antitoxin [Spongisporangium articulatum]|uniref:Type IV toxin-antitoxin system AbiEi family antitoxin n=1 Tax=Spongisporangium articulatum TaxID=3362603 RepID=A0ABW8ANN9_9ACTN